jgi:hypothetical protein
MDGYYIHHVGHGHLRQALAITAASSHPFTLLSSLPRPADYAGPWVQLPRDDTDDTPVDPTAYGQLHWAPLGDTGLRERMAMIAEWIRTARPAAMVVDVSVEVTALARLMGVRVVAMVLPGTRADPAHRLGYALAEELIVPWPESIGSQLTDGTQPWTGKMRFTGAFSRYDSRPPAPRSSGRPTVLVLHGQGGTTLTQADIASARASAPDWDWTVLGGDEAPWVEDPWPLLSTCDVIVTHAGLNAIAEVAAARRPAIVIPQPRPHEEQLTTAAALAHAGLAITLNQWPPPDQWPKLLDAATKAGGERWALWSTGDGARRAAAIIDSVADRDHSGDRVPSVRDGE